MKLFTGKSHVRATLWKLSRQTGSSLPLTAKCSPLLHVIRASSWRWPDVVAGVSARFFKENFFCFISFIKKVCLIHSFCYITNRLVNCLLGNSRFSLFPSASSREALGFSEAKFTVPLGTNHHVYRHWWYLNFHATKRARDQCNGVIFSMCSSQLDFWISKLIARGPCLESLDNFSSPKSHMQNSDQLIL